MNWICGDSCPEMMFDLEESVFENHEIKLKLMTGLHLFKTLVEMPLLLEVVYLPIQPLIKTISRDVISELNFF